MKSLWNSFKIAFSMFSKIPMPQADWSKENMKYMFLFFPWIGMVIGAVVYGAAYAGGKLGFQTAFINVVLLLIPVFINFKGFLPVSALVSPYASCDIGGGFGVGDISGLSGFMCTPAVGVQVGMFQVQVGYALQQFSEEGIGLSCNAVQFKLGVNF